PEKTRHVLDDTLLERLGRSCDVLSTAPLETFATPESRRLLAAAEVLVTGWACPLIGPEVLRAAPNLRLIAHAAGTVKFAVDPSAYGRGIRVSHAADANAVPVAEFTLA